MARTLFFRTVFRKFSEITNNKPVFSQYKIFYNHEYFFFNLYFDLYSIIDKRVDQTRNTHDGPLQCFSTYFRKLKEMGVLRPIFPDHVISCDYDLMNLDSTSICDIIYLQFTVFSVKISIVTSKVDKLQFSCKIAPYGKSLVTIFQEIFTSIEKIFILGGRLSTRLYNSINF